MFTVSGRALYGLSGFYNSSMRVLQVFYRGCMLAKSSPMVAYWLYEVSRRVLIARAV